MPADAAGELTMKLYINGLALADDHIIELKYIPNMNPQ